VSGKAPPAPRLRRYWLAPAALVLVCGALFAVAEALQAPILSDPGAWSDSGAVAVAAGGVLVLLIDVGLPVPSSFVMATLGAVHGTWVGGLLSLAGVTGATLLGFAVGRAGTGVVRRLATPDEHDRANALLRRWGALAIVVTRPIPILAETVAILAGASPLGWTRTAIAAVVGAVPPSFAYAAAGAAGSGLGAG
jgi:uncharacterized membrane protein YdjX (TVP38/TMEM64 family)